MKIMRKKKPKAPLLARGTHAFEGLKLTFRICETSHPFQDWVGYPSQVSARPSDSLVSGDLRSEHGGSKWRNWRTVKKLTKSDSKSTPTGKRRPWIRGIRFSFWALQLLGTLNQGCSISAMDPSKTSQEQLNKGDWRSNRGTSPWKRMKITSTPQKGRPKFKARSVDWS